jgi:hypothetical protein
MHYRNGREAKNGDRVVKFSTSQGKIEAVGILADAVAGNDYCNGIIAPILYPGTSTACMIDCIHADDLAEILKEKGLDKRPEGK